MKEQKNSLLQKEVEKIRKEKSKIQINIDGVNYHLIAIENIKNTHYLLRRWWHKKYSIPPKGIEEYTSDELFVEYLEDFYEENPEKINEFFANEDKDWDGVMSNEHEERMKEWSKNKEVDLTPFQAQDDSGEFEENY